ncbi:unnamed protein product [Pneumocystis jirovecii]|uniref:Uncharacterized protein n=1 Tax=Pneumocystis jirovecii TaxID=42068 RepID=L0PCZ9_PNEJI|nr:unnamed protein product [Pneumocystis jirovecii]CCJ29500.1 unnamed protein product [Pneumocystis jirovecii]
MSNLIEEQKKKHASLVSQQDILSSNKQAFSSSKNEDLVKIDCFSFLGLKTPSDPASIKTYPRALRYIIHRIYWDSSLLKKITEMIEEQTSYEEKWWNDRQALIKSWESKKEVNKVIANVSGIEKVSDENIEQELLSYDLKVHRAIQEMSKAQEKEFQRLGIPFFMDENETNIENKKKMVQLLKDLVSE